MSPVNSSGIIVVDDTDQSPIFSRTIVATEGSVLMVFPRADSALFALEQLIRAELIREKTIWETFPQPPRALGRSIPAREVPNRGVRRPCGGWGCR